MNTFTVLANWMCFSSQVYVSVPNKYSWWCTEDVVVWLEWLTCISPWLSVGETAMAEEGKCIIQSYYTSTVPLAGRSCWPFIAFWMQHSDCQRGGHQIIPYSLHVFRKCGYCMHNIYIYIYPFLLLWLHIYIITMMWLDILQFGALKHLHRRHWGMYIVCGGQARSHVPQNFISDASTSY